MAVDRSVIVLFGAPDGTGSMKMMHSYTAAMCRAGYTVTLLHGDTIRGGLEPIPAAGQSLLDDLAARGVKLVATDTFRSSNPAALPLELRALCKGVDADAVMGFHQADRAYVVGAKAFGARAILCIQNLHSFHGDPRVQQVKELAYRTIVGRADLLIASSEAVEAELASRFGISGDRVVVIPNSIDVAGFAAPSDGARERFREAHGLSDDDLVLLNVGRIDPQKGQIVLIDALEGIDIANTVTFIAGGSSAGSTNDEFYDLVHSRVEASPLTDRIVMLGWRDDIRDLLDACDIYVHPSIWEGWPLAIVEAMAASKPVVLSDCVGRPTGFVDGTHGEVTPAGDADSFGAAIERVAARSAEDRAAMGAACRQLALDHYDLQVASAKFLDSISGVLR